MNKLTLTKRNLLTLLSKLDRIKGGDVSACCIIKQDTEHKRFAQTMKYCAVYGTEDKTEFRLDPEMDHLTLSRATMAELLTTLGAHESVEYRKIHPALTLTVASDGAYYDERKPGFVHPADNPELKAAEKKAEDEEDDGFLSVAAALLDGVHDETGQRGMFEEKEEDAETSSTEGGDAGGGGASDDIPEPDPEPEEDSSEEDDSEDDSSDDDDA